MKTKSKKQFELAHPCFAIEKSVIEKIKEIIASRNYTYNDNPSISSFIREAVYEKLDREEKEFDKNLT